MTRDVTTMRAAAPGPSGGHELAVVGLTLLLHADPSRVGQWSELPERGYLSRLEPEFAPPRSPSHHQREPLSDPNISRRPIGIHTLKNGSIRLTAAEGGTDVRINGVPLGETVLLSSEAIDEGVTIELAERVALLLHRRRRPKAQGQDMGLVGDSEALDLLREQIAKVADLEVPVLLRGPTGVGKELVARAIHAQSQRGGGAMVAVNLVTLPASMAASELFGHEKGAFTGAQSKRAGFFERAHGGTLFLDEVAETGGEVQAMLLRAIESQEILPLGGAEPLRVDARLIAATDADLEEMVGDGRFREPLLHRLAGYQILLPPLCERRDDVARLLLHFLKEELHTTGEAHRLDGASPDRPLWLPAALVARLCRYTWPGNVRELRNVARHIVIAGRGEEVLPESSFLLAFGDPERAAQERAQGGKEIDEDTLIRSLRRHSWKTGATASELGISRTTLYALMDRSDRIRKAKDLGEEEIRQVYARVEGDLDALSRTLEVSKRGLQLRIKELGLRFD